MKTLVSLVVLLFAADAGAASLQYELIGGKYGRLSVSIERNNALAQRLADALIKSRRVSEVKNGYVQPRTVYQGEGFTLDLSGGGSGRSFINVQLELQNPDLERLSLGNGFVSFSAKRGAASAFHLALLESASEHVATKRHMPSYARIGSRMEGEATVLEQENFGGNSINCGFNSDRRDMSQCSIKLQR